MKKKWMKRVALIVTVLAVFFAPLTLRLMNPVVGYLMTPTSPTMPPPALWVALGLVFAVGGLRCWGLSDVVQYDHIAKGLINDPGALGRNRH